MNTYNLSSTPFGAGRQFHTPTLPVHIEAADSSSTGSSLRRVRTVNGKASQEMFERVHVTCGGPSNLKRVRTVNKKVGKAILERRKVRAVIKVAKPSPVSSILNAFKKLAGSRAPATATAPATTTTTVSSEPVLPSTPKRSAKLSSPPPLEYKKSTRTLQPTVSIKPIRLFYGLLYDGDSKARVHSFDTWDNAPECAPNMWAAARD